MEIFQFLNNKGQGLVEALVALGAASVIIAAIAISVVSAVNNSDYSKNQNKATALAQQEMEILSQESRTNWSVFNARNGSYCAFNPRDLKATIEECNKVNSALIDNVFIRQVDIQKGDSTNCQGNVQNGTSVKVTVKWTDGKCDADDYCHSVYVQSCFTNINLTPSP